MLPFVVRPSLFIAVVDRSGSMNGNPWKQVETALLHIMGLTRSTPFVRTIIIAYDSNAEIINTSGTEADVYRVIKNMFTGGGTNFLPAFARIKEVLAQYICDDKDTTSTNNVCSATVAFLTDGQASENRNDLIAAFNTLIAESWHGPITVHSIGFGDSCDKVLLEGLWKTTPNGTFRYAEPSDHGDTLCGKLTNLFELVSKSSTVGVSLKLSTGRFKRTGTSECIVQFPVDTNKRGKHCEWIYFDTLPELTLNSSLDKDMLIKLVASNGDTTLFHAWCAKCIDDLATELLELSKQDKVAYGVQVYELHIALLQQKCAALIRANSDVVNAERLTFLKSQLQVLKAGLEVHAGKLADLRFASQYAALPSSERKPVAIAHANNTTLAVEQVSEAEHKERVVYYNRNNKDKGRNSLQEVIMSTQKLIKGDMLDKLLASCTDTDLQHVDADGNNTLLLACYCGQYPLLEQLLLKFKLDVNVCNKGETPLTLAIKTHGFFRCVQLLVQHHASLPNGRGKALEQFAIDHGYTRTAAFIANLGDDNCSSIITENMSPEYIRFTYERVLQAKLDFNVSEYLRIALKKQMWDLVQILVSKHQAYPTLEMLMEYCIPDCHNLDECPAEYVRIGKFLFTYDYRQGKINVHQANADGDTLLFRASERGSRAHVKLLLSLGAKVDQPNNLGNTPLWIACWKRYPCIIEELLNAGADVNRCNLKGNPPMVSICQKGPRKIAETLLAAGATINHLNANGDSMILIACRNGQADVLDCLLTRADPKIVNHVAQIDGFSAILAATEANRPECIEVLHKYGIDLNTPTASDNAILAGATPLHLAAYYGRYEAAQKLISLGAQINPLDVHGQTPLHTAVIQNNCQIVELLCKNGADISIQDSQRNTALSYCRQDVVRQAFVDPALDVLLSLARGEFDPTEQERACKLLARESRILAVHAPSSAVNITDVFGYSPLMTAVIYSNFEVAKLLISLGADPGKVNLYKINTYVWANWVGNFKIRSLLPSNLDLSSGECLDRLKQASRLSTQDAMILYLNTKPSLAKVTTNSNLNARMNDFVTFINNGTSDSNSKEPTEEPKNILTLVEATEKQDNLVLARQQLIWQAKIFTVNTIASGVTTLSPSQVFTLYMYNTFGTSNKLYLNHLLETLLALPCFTGESYIGTAVHFDRTEYALGKTIRLSSIQSASTLWRVATENVPEFSSKKQGTVFILKGKTGRLISNYSAYPSDAELLFLPNTSFRVTHWYRGDVICLGQENIREHTFKIKEEDLPAMISSNKGLIIELEEM